MYNIYLHEVPERGIDEGWWGGGSSRVNSVIYDRTDDKRDAFEMDEWNAVAFYAEFKSQGWPCEIVPDISDKRKLELLTSGPPIINIPL